MLASSDKWGPDFYPRIPFPPARHKLQYRRLVGELKWLRPLEETGRFLSSVWGLRPSYGRGLAVWALKLGVAFACDVGSGAGQGRAGKPLVAV
jgi:hypothetical protein